MRSTVFLLIVLQIVNGDLVDKTTLPPLVTTPSDPCSTSHEIASADRVVSSDVTTGRCDDNLNGGWYRFTVNDVPATLPTVCLRPGACGGAVSLRIDLGDQPLPDVGKEVMAWSCGAYDILGKFDCCVLRQPAKIRNCSSFLAYQLQKPDRCDVAYCVEHPRERIPSNVLRKYGEDVSPQSDDTTTPSSSSPATTPDFANSNWCIEGMVWCTRGAPSCMSYDECLAIPLTTNSSSDITTGTSQATTAPTATTETTPASDVTTEKTTVDSDATTSPNIAEKTTSGNDITTSPNIAGETTLGSDVTTTPNIAEKTTLDSDATTPPYIAEKTTLDSDATTPPNIAEKTTPDLDDTTPPNIAGTTTDSGVTNTEAEDTTTSSSPSPDTTVLRGLFPYTTTLSPNDDSVTTEESTAPGPSPTASVTTSGDYSTTGSTGGMSGHPDNVPRTDATSTDGDTSSTARTTEDALVQTTDSSSSFSSSSTAAAAGGHVDRSTNQETTSSISSTSAASSSSTMASTTSSSSATQSTLPVHSTEGSSSTESEVFTTEAGSTKATSASPPGSVDGRIVLEFATDTNVNYTASAKKCMSELLNTYGTGRNIAHTFNAGDVNVMTVDTSSTTTTVVLRVVFDESVGRVVMTAGDLINMLMYLQKENRLNTQQCTRNLGKMQDFYRYGEQPTTPPPKSRRSYSLFYDKLPLFIAIIVMVTVCFLILIFGIVYLRFFHHHRKWDRTKDVERAKLKETKEHQGLENPVPDSEMMKDEAVVTETSLTVNGSHPQHSVPLDDDKGWVIPIDQAPETQFQVALKSEDTQL